MMPEAHARARDFAMQNLQALHPEERTPEMIRFQVEMAVEFVNRAVPGSLDPDAVEDLAREIESLLDVFIGEYSILDGNELHEPWLPYRREVINWDFWDRYRRYLGHTWSTPQTVEHLNELTDDILGRLEDPLRAGPWDRRGLVVGHVQSGKTANYTGLICKAVDSGYRLVVVLAGMHNNLRAQTQIRLEEGFLGYSSGPDAAKEPIGAGIFPPRIAANTITTRAENGDFNKKVAKQFFIGPGQDPLLFVVKKNGSTLRNLLGWVRGFAKTDPQTGRQWVEDVPILIIDDEADQASINTKKDDEDPTAINARIRELLFTFSKSAYVGYTATPFANIFIYEQAKNEDQGPDLFPRSFIVSLPAPSTYIGPSRVFGFTLDDETGEERPALRLVRVVEDARPWMPHPHRKDHDPVSPSTGGLPESLRTAILSYLLAGAAKAARGLGTEHHSMLIHVTRFVDVQGRVFDQVVEEYAKIKRRLVYGDGTAGIRAELRHLWESDFVPTSASVLLDTSIADPKMVQVTWDDVEPHLAPLAELVVVRKVNGTATDALEYEANKAKGYKVIAIGGDKLSRGLTLEGLSTSYFLRASQMYDTLMQMGRWFGYRPGYVDVCRLFTTSDIVEWFEHITEANEELRKEFESMAKYGATPEEYGLKVKSHPTLMVTSQVKMRKGVKLQVSFSEDIEETTVFRKEPAAIEHNLASAADLLSALEVAGIRPEPAITEESTRWIWRDAPAGPVIDFLRAYAPDASAFKANPEVMARYIEKLSEKKDAELSQWTIVLFSPQDPADPNPESVRLGGGLVRLMKRRTRRLGPTEEKGPVQGNRRLRIRRFLGSDDERFGSTADEIEDAEKRRRELDPDGTKRLSLGPILREQRDASRGVLMLALLDPKEIGYDTTLPAESPPVTAFAVSFPKSTSEDKVTYDVNHVYYDALFGEDAFDEEDDE